ncbi:C13 family peptidase [Hyphomonas sp.]|uniref:C13 family peptidase n=1 Tax=Hyphomonas sp. TaxID=87 RepID=UPI00391A3A97
MALRSLAALLVSVIWLCGPALAEPEPEAPKGPFSDWAVGILAADWRDGSGAPIAAFDNAARDLASAFTTIGFRPENIASLSLRPMRFGGDSLMSEDVFALFESQAKSATAGCLFYFTSHGMREGLLLGNEGFLSPARLNGLIGEWCGERPTVVVVSACHSGVFVPALSAPNRMIMTAARPDRVSFGCSADARYPYFDGCILESLPAAEDFVHLASLAGRCVAGKEWAQRLSPASEPMTRVGADVEDLFVFMNFERAVVPEEAATGAGAGMETAAE